MSLKKASILIIDDDTDVLTAVRLLVRPEVKMIVTEKNPANIHSLLAQQEFDIILLDMNFNSAVNTGNEGFFWLNKIRTEFRSKAAVVMITAYADIDLAVRSLKEGAADFVVKPWHNERLLETLSEILINQEKGKPAKLIGANSLFKTELLGESEIMQDVFYKIKKVAPTDANILILGENGTGKELVAKAIHQFSNRSVNPFIKVDVGALTETLFESELFGHKKGAFTDAQADRTGRFEAANTGTLFLDEIGNISLSQQAKLLTVLQNRQVTKLGTNEAIPIDIRLVCATNIPLSKMADEARFRKDLVYRINTVEITIPPLRQRGPDILLLARHFSKMYSEKYWKPLLLPDEKAASKLMQYHYPGNVRELQYSIERAVIMAEGNMLTATDIIFSPIETVEPVTKEEATNLGALEKSTILRSIERQSGNISKAAKELGITRTALYRRLNKYDL